MIKERCINCGTKVEWIILGINLCLFAVKLSFALLSHSKSLMADAFESLANFIITIVVLISLHLANRGADEKFPYGYGKVEFLASGIVNAVLMIAAMAFIIVSFHDMIIVGSDIPPSPIAIVAALISIAANQAAFSYGRCVGTKLGSPVIMANAWVNRADVGTSIAVIVAVIGTNLGFLKLDHIVAILIGALIIKVTSDGVRKALKGLMDVPLKSEELRITDLTEGVKGVSGVGNVKARLAGRKLLVDMEVVVPGDWLTSKGVAIIRKISSVLHAKMQSLGEVSIQLIPHKIKEE